MCASSPCGKGKEDQRPDPGFQGGGRELGECHEELISLHCCRTSGPIGMSSPPCKHSPWLRSKPRHRLNQTLPAPGSAWNSSQQWVPPACCRQSSPTPALALYLHPGLHHIQGGVAKDTGSSSNGSKHPCYEGVHHLVGIVPCEGREVEGRVVVGFPHAFPREPARKVPGLAPCGQGAALSWGLSSSTCPTQPTLHCRAQGGCESDAPAPGPVSPTSSCHSTLVFIFLHSK